MWGGVSGHQEYINNKLFDLKKFSSMIADQEIILFTSHLYIRS